MDERIVHRMTWVLAATAISAAMHPCGAQSDGNAPLLLELPASTRALGLGGAFVLSAGQSDAIFYNAGALVDGSGGGLAVQRYGSSSTMGAVSAATDWAGGTLAFGAQAISYGSATSRFEDVTSDANDLLNDASLAVSELAGSVGYARELYGFRAGIVARVIEQRFGGGRDETAAADIGVIREVMGIALGLSVRNIGPGLGIGGGELPLPTRVTAGASTPKVPVGPLDVLISTAVSRRRDGWIVPSGGLELEWWPIVGRTFIARLGLRRVPGDGASPFTAGLGFRGDLLAIEYAFEQFEAPGASHRLALSWH